MDGFVRAKHDRALHLPLAQAAERTFYQVTGKAMPREAMLREQVLSSVAHALTNLIPIYVLADPDAPPRQVTPCEFLLSKFSDGATALNLRGGSQLRSLTVRAADLGDAVTVLRSVKAWFVVREMPSPPEPTPLANARRFADDSQEESPYARCRTDGTGREA
jgi:hypothetical protein